MTHNSMSAKPPASFLQLRQGIDLARLKRLDQEAPADPTRAAEPLVVAHSRNLGCSDLLV